MKVTRSENFFSFFQALPRTFMLGRPCTGMQYHRGGKGIARVLAGAVTGVGLSSSPCVYVTGTDTPCSCFI